MNYGAMLNAYPDSMGGTLSHIADMLEAPELKDAFQSFYILPSVFHTDLDRGFSIISYELNQMLASAADLERLKALSIDLKMDFVLNHLSVLSPQFQDILQKGDASPYRDFFIDWNKFWDGCGEMTEGGYIQPRQEYLRDMFFRKPGLPILMVRLPDGREAPYWNTFYQEVRYPALDAQDLMREAGLQYAQAQEAARLINAAIALGQRPCDIDLGALNSVREQALSVLNHCRHYLGQMDLNIQSPQVWDYYHETLKKLASYGAAIVRLDAFAYAPKTPGKRNFMNDPETWELLERIRQMAATMGLTVLPEIHASYADAGYKTLASMGYMVYDFFLPGLVIDAIENHDAQYLACWAREILQSGIRTVNMLGCHDGIPMLDLKGMIPEERIQALIDLIVSRGGLIKNLHGQKNVYYQVNATYYSALGEDDRKMLLARALQLFMPGKPQVWYLDLFAGRNDQKAVACGGAAGHKEINRTNLSASQMAEALARPVVQKQLRLLRLRNLCPAFAEDAAIQVETPQKHRLTMRWQNGEATAILQANLLDFTFTVEAAWDGGREQCEQVELM